MIRINRQYCNLIENGYGADFYSIQMPNSSQYKDYTVNVYLNITVGRDYFIEIKKPIYKEDYIFILVKTERQQGKKYKRPKLTYEELEEELKEYNAEFDLSQCSVALAQFNEYEFDKRHKDLTATPVYKIGHIKGKWFIEESFKRHLISAKNFKIIKNDLPEEEIERLKQTLNRLDYLTNYYDELLHNRANNRISLPKSASAPLLTAVENLLNVFRAEEENTKKEIAKLTEELEKIGG